MDFPTGYQTSCGFRVTGTLPPGQLDKTGKSLLESEYQPSGYSPGGSPGASPSVSPAASPTAGGKGAGDADGRHVVDAAQLAEAQQGSAKADAALVVDKKQQCIDLLIAGCVDSFVDLLKITHKTDTEVKEEIIEDPVGLPTHALTLEEVLKKDKKKKKEEVDVIYLKETLEKAENSRRSKNYHSAIEYYRTLAQYLESPAIADLQSARYFYKRCIVVAEQINQVEGSALELAKANLAMGICEENLKSWRSAMQFHETSLELSTEADCVAIQTKAAYQLCNVYRVLAEQIMNDNSSGGGGGNSSPGGANGPGMMGEDGNAPTTNKTPEEIRLCSDLYEKCVACSKLAKDIKLEGINCWRLGKVKTLSGEYEDALRLQRQYLQICEAEGDKSGEATARAALAQAYQGMGDTKLAIQELEILLTVAANAGELEAQAQACLNLGLLYSNHEEHEKSIRLLERHFDLARQMQDRETIDRARVILGIARGNGKLDLFFHLCKTDLGKLLEWKSRRAPLE